MNMPFSFEEAWYTTLVSERDSTFISAPKSACLLVSSYIFPFSLWVCPTSEDASERKNNNEHTFKIAEQIVLE